MLQMIVTYLRDRRVSGTCVGVFALAGCASVGAAHDEAPEGAPAVASATAPLVIAPNRTEVVAYRNAAGDEGLPEIVPVVVSYDVKGPSVAFRIACGSNYGRMLEGFGYSMKTFNIDTVDRYSSLDGLTSELRRRTPNDHDVPMRTLRCDADESVVRSQLLAIFRVVNADPSKGQASYYARLRDDHGSIYSLGCWNFVKALGWDNGTTPPATTTTPPNCDWGCGWEDSTTTPINQAILKVWSDAGVVTRELNCYNETGRPLPPVNASLPSRLRPGPAQDAATLFRVSYAFDGISAPKPLYLISNGKGYALDCGSNQREIKEALGFDPDQPVDELAASDPRFLASNPGGQPNIRCNDPNVQIFVTKDESPPSTYVQFGGAPRLFRFTSDRVASLFADSIQGFPWFVPRSSIPYLFPDATHPNAPTEVFRVGSATTNECESESANCATGESCVDDPVGFHCRPCPVGETSFGYACYPAPEFRWYDTLEADRTALGFSTYGGKTGNDWLRTAGILTAHRMATLYCRTKGFPAGRVNGWTNGEKMGANCLPYDAPRFETTKAEREAADSATGDITKADWSALSRAANRICPLKGYDAGFFTGETNGTNAVLYCLPKNRTTWFDSTLATRAETGWPFPADRPVDWDIAAGMATTYCALRGYVGGIMTGDLRYVPEQNEAYWGLHCFK